MYTLIFILAVIIGTIMYYQPPEKCFMTYNGAGFLIGYIGVFGLVVKLLLWYFNDYDKKHPNWRNKK